MIPQIADASGEMDRAYPPKPLPAKLQAQARERKAAPGQLLRVLTIEQVDEHRNLACIHYDFCLDVAIAGNWMSFSCKACPNYAGGEDQTGGSVSEVTGDTRREAPHA